MLDHRSNWPWLESASTAEYPLTLSRIFAQAPVLLLRQGDFQLEFRMQKNVSID